MKNKLINKNILVIGDSIIDKDIYVSDLGKSLETDNAKFKFINQTFELGGASRLVNFISTFDVNIVFFSNLEEQYFKEFSNLFSKLEIYKTNTTSSVEKIRIKLKNDNIFETVFQINKDYKSKHNSYSEILNILNKTFDAVLIDDYRTGMFDKQLIDIVNNLSYEKILFASQLSRNNLNIRNYTNFNILILNKYEFESEFNTKLDFDYNYADIFSNDIKKIIVTLGNDGALLITKKKNTYFPTKSKEFVNTIGAGDIFLASYLMFEDVNLANEHTLNYLEELNNGL